MVLNVLILPKSETEGRNSVLFMIEISDFYANIKSITSIIDAQCQKPRGGESVGSSERGWGEYSHPLLVPIHVQDLDHDIESSWCAVISC